MIYVTSDLHFNHDKEFIYEARGFKDIKEHDKALIENWNSIIGNDDDVYILGDIVMGTDKEYSKKCLEALNGRKHCLIGNHDTVRKMELYRELGFLCYGYADMLDYKKWKFYISHYPTKVGGDKEKPLKKQIWNLCGHNHTDDKFSEMKENIYHCELDAQDMEPVSIEQIIQDIKAYKIAEEIISKADKD